MMEEIKNKALIRKFLSFIFISFVSILTIVVSLFLRISSRYPISCELDVVSFGAKRYSICSKNIEIIGPTVLSWGKHENFIYGYLDVYEHDAMFPAGYFFFSSADTSVIMTGLTLEQLKDRVSVTPSESLQLIEVSSVWARLHGLVYFIC